MTRLTLLTVTVFLALAVAACNSPQPLPTAPTPIPTLLPATLPPPTTPTPRAVAANIVFPAAPPSAKSGETAYQSKCASCHGSDGKGKVEKARNFTDIDYMRGAAPAEFFEVITAGKDQMPAFNKDLTDDDSWNTVYYLWSFSVKPEQLAKGKTTFEANCVACHGPDGKGAIPQAPNFTKPEFIASRPATELYQSVSGGKGIMPAWQDRLSADDRWNAIEYVRSFGYQP
jgi:cytochrome c oxidase cbb3-type subunit III